MRRQREQACRVCNQSCTVDMLLPDWEKQWNRLQVPCKGTHDYMWFRTGDVITLGELFLALGGTLPASWSGLFWWSLAGK